MKKQAVHAGRPRDRVSRPGRCRHFRNPSRLIAWRAGAGLTGDEYHQRKGIEASRGVKSPPSRSEYRLVSEGGKGVRHRPAGRHGTARDAQRPYLPQHLRRPERAAWLVANAAGLPRHCAALSVPKVLDELSDHRAVYRPCLSTQGHRTAYGNGHEALSKGSQFKKVSIIRRGPCFALSVIYTMFNLAYWRLEAVT